MRALPILILMASILGANAEVFEAKMGLSMSVPGPYWGPFDSGDGAGYLNTDVTNLAPAVVTLSSTLQPGTYNVFVKALRYFTENDPPYYTVDPIQVVLGPGSATKQLFPNDSDSSGQWTGPLQVTLDTATNKIATTFLLANPTKLYKVLYLGVAVTDNLDYIVTPQDEFISMGASYPTPSASVSPSGNLMPNASFETGINNGWALTSTSRDYVMSSLWTTNKAHSGIYSVRLASSAQMLSRVYRTGANRTYTLSAWIFADTNNLVAQTAQLAIENTYTPPDGFQPRVIVYTNADVPLDNQWHRVSVSGTLYAYPAANYQLKVTSWAGVGMWVDDIQFEEGPITTFTPQQWSLGVAFAATGAVFSATGTHGITLRIRNESSVNTNAYPQLQIWSSKNQLLYTNFPTAGVSVGAASNVVVNVPLLPHGHYRAVATLQGRDYTREEATFSVVPLVPQNGWSAAGSHTMGTTEGAQFGQRLGMNWTRTLSPANTFRWGNIEAVDDTFDWSIPDAQVPLLAATGINIMGVLGEEANPPWAEALAASNPDAYVIAYSNFVKQTVARYYGSVSCWEIVNEPNASELGPYPALYARCLKVATDNILAIDPTATIVAMGGCGYGYAASVITNLAFLFPAWNWTNDIHVVSAHLYPGGGELDADDWYDNIIVPLSLQVWNTETGAWSDPFHTTANAGFRRNGRSVLPWRQAARFYHSAVQDPQELLWNSLTCFGYQFSRYFYYDTRIWHSLAPGTAPTLREYDDTVKPQGVALSASFALLNAATLAKKLDFSDATIEGYLFTDTNNHGMACLWKRLPPFKLLNTTSAVEVLDEFVNSGGNGTNLVVHQLPIYIRSSLSPASLEATLENGPLSTYVDTQAPRSFVADWSSAAGSRNEFWVRYLAIDDIDLPLDSTPDAIQYSYKLLGVDADWSDWTSETWISYGNLPTGAYTFMVRARDSSGNVSDTVSEVFDYITNESTSTTILGNLQLLPSTTIR